MGYGRIRDHFSSPDRRCDVRSCIGENLAHHLLLPFLIFLILFLILLQNPQWPNFSLELHTHVSQFSTNEQIVKQMYPFKQAKYQWTDTNVNEMQTF